MAQPTANFTSNKVAGCAPIVVQFTDQSTGNPTSWSWDLGNGTTSTLQNPSTTYITPGTYTVKLTAANSSGSNLKTMTNYITVYPSPVVGFSGDSLPGCTPKNVVFSNNTTLGTATGSYLWDFGDGNTSAQNNPSHIYTSIGNYTVTLIATNSYGCTKSLSKPSYVKTVQGPIANFTSTNKNGCSTPHTVNFTNTSANANTYSWNFGDGATSSLANPSHTYTATGSYNVTLIATNSYGCKDTIVKTAFVTIGILNSQFIPTATTACAGTSIIFNNATTPLGGTYNWNFDDGATSTQSTPAHTYINAGVYTVRLISTLNGCSDTSTQNITVNAKPTVAFTANNTIGCSVPFPVQFTNSSTNATSYLWKFGNGNTSTQTNPSTSYAAFGNYSVKLVATGANGCKDSLTKTNYIKVQQPTATLTATPTQGCAPLNVNFTANITSLIPVSNYSWNFGDGSSASNCASCPTKSHTYTTAGSYTAKLTYTTGAGCSFTVQKVVKTGNKPNASFTTSADTICPGYAINCTNTTTGGATNYKWYNGAGDSAITTNASFGYRSGSFTITLIASQNGCTDTFSKNVYVRLPRAAFTKSYQCSNRKKLTFTDQSQGANSYYWNFGDGNTSTVSGTVSHTYAAYGTYLVKLGVKNNATGCTDTNYMTVNVVPLTSDFSANATEVCKGNHITFTASSAYQYASYRWQLYGYTGITTSTPTLTYPYNTPGIFNVRLIVVDSNGCSDTTLKTNYIKVGGATVNFTSSPTGGCLPLNVNFQDLSTPNGGFAIVNRSWDLGNGTTSTQANPSTTYTTPGQYDIKLTVTDANGCVTSLTKNDFITASKPTAAFTSPATDYCKGSTVTFNNTSTGNGLSYNWSYGDGTTGTANSHNYTTAGLYTVKLVVTDSFGCKDSIVKANYINIKSPTINFTLSDSTAPCPPLAVNFTNTSVNASSFHWDFGNGSQSSLANNTSSTYTYPGVYTAKLIGQDSEGCKDSASKTITVYGPTGTFSYTPLSGCMPLTVSFSATTSNTSLLIWDLNNGVTQNTTTGSHSYTYTQPGRYVPKLILSDNASCLVPITGTDTIVVDHMEADFSFSPVSLCDSGTVQFTDTVIESFSATATRSWTFGDGNTSTAHNPSHLYAAPGNYQVRLVITNTKGCSDTIEKTVIVHPLPNVNAGADIAICEGGITPVTLQATGATTYSWAPSTGLSCTNCANPSALPTDTTAYIVTGTDSNGCINTDTVIITVNPLPVISVNNNQPICVGDSVQLQATGATTYNWTPGTGLSCTNCNNPFAKPAATTTYTLTGINANGCSDSITVTVKVNPLPNVNAGTDKTICSGDSIQLQAAGAATYSWTPSTGLSCSNCSNPYAKPGASTTYTLTGIDTNGCSNTDQVALNINALPSVSAGANKAICAGFSTSLQATGAVSYTWTPSTGLSCTNCTNPTATPLATTTYIVTGVDNNGCKDTGKITVTVNPMPTISISNNQPICAGGFVQLHATGAANYVWTPSTGLSCNNCASPNASPITTTTYTVKGTSSAGCTDSTTVTVKVNPLPVINAGTDKEMCQGDSVQLQASGAGTYSWSPTAGLSCNNCANPYAKPIATVSYVVTGTDTNGCSSTDIVLVTVNPLPNVNAGPNKSICLGSTATLQATGAASYSWTPSAGLSCSNCASPSASPASNISYVVTGTDSKGCVNTDTVNVAVNPIPTIAATGITKICEGDTTSLHASGGSSYVWSPTGSISCTNCQSTIAAPVVTTTYKVTGTLNGCSDSATITVNVLPKPNISAGANKSICEGGAVDLKATGGISYSWTPPTSLSCLNCANTTANPATTTTYIVTGKDSAGCVNTANVTVNVHPTPDVNAGTDQTICEGSSGQLNATGAKDYSWTPNTNISCTNCADPTVNPFNTISYSVEGTDMYGCRDSDKIIITVIKKGEVAYGPGDTLCKGESTQLNASGGTSYSWSPSTGLSNADIANPNAMPEVTTTYTVIIKQGDCFTDTGNVLIVVNELPVVNAGEDRQVSAGSTVSLKAETNQNVSYEWTPASGLSCADCASPQASPKSAITYIVTVINEWGCKASDDVTINVSCDQGLVYVANTFTPNGDGVNDWFYPQGKGITEVKRFSVYNRWGQLLFDANNIPLNDPYRGWDGTYKNERLKPDVFVYILQATCEGGEPINMKGDISLIR